MLDEYNRPIRLKSGRISIGKAEESAELFNVADAASRLSDNYGEDQGLSGQEQVEIIVQETLPEHLDQQPSQQKVLAFEEPDAVVVEVASENGGDVSSDPQPQPMEPEPAQTQPQPQPPAPWEILAEDIVEEEELESSGEDGTKPMSRAERRRKIKEDIQKLAQGDEPIYYQRRLW